MMPSVDAAATAPVPGVRNGGRSNGGSHSAFQDCLDGVPMPHADVPHNIKSSSPRTERDAGAPRHKRRVEHSGEGTGPVAPIAPVAPVTAAVHVVAPRSIVRAANDATPPADLATPVAAADAADVDATAAPQLVPPSQQDLPLAPSPTLTDAAPPQTTGASVPPPELLPVDTAAASAAVAVAVDAMIPADLVVATAVANDAGTVADNSTPADVGPATDVAPAAVAPLQPGAMPDAVVAAGPSAEPPTAAAPAAPTAETAETAEQDEPAAGVGTALTRPPASGRDFGAAQAAMASDYAGGEHADTVRPPMAAAKRPSAAPLGVRSTASTGPQPTNGQLGPSIHAALDPAGAPAAAAPPLPSAATAPTMVTASEVGQLQVDVDLGGEGLGPLRLRAKAVAGELHVSLTATDPHLRATLVDNAHDLRRDLQSSGIELASYDVNGSFDPNTGTGAEHGDPARSGEQRSASGAAHRAANGSRQRSTIQSIQPAAVPSPAGLDLRL